MKRLTAILLSAALAVPALAQTPPAVTPPGAAGGVRPPAAAATGPRAQIVEGPVAIVNDQVISQSDVKNRMKFMLLSFNQQPSQDVLREVQAEATQALVNEKLQMQEFHKMLKKAEVKKEEIDQEIADLAKRNNMTPENFTAGLAGEGISIQGLRDSLEAGIGWQMLIGARYGRQVRISDQRIDQQIARLKENADKEQFRVAEIFLYAPDKDSRANAMARAATLKDQVEKGADFLKVAQQFSAAPSASQGGDLGWISPADMRTEIQAAVVKSTPPSVLPPIEGEGGVYLIAVLGKREPADNKTATLDMKQVVAKGDGAAAKLEQVKAQARTCSEAITAASKVEGVSVNDMNGIVLSQLADQFRPVVEPLQVDQSSPVLDVPDGKMALFVCKRVQGAPMPSRAAVRNNLFEQELGMWSERYLRDIKREATIVMR